MIAICDAKTLYQEMIQLQKDHSRSRFVFGRRLVYGQDTPDGPRFAKSWDNGKSPTAVQLMMYSTHYHVRQWSP